MLKQIMEVTPEAVEKLFALYRESMDGMAGQFAAPEEMRAAYAGFLAGFVQAPGRLVLVEEEAGKWVSGLRAVEQPKGVWFLEAVETMPEERRKGYGKALLLDTLAELDRRGGTEVSCTIGRHNGSSIALHTGCGFAASGDPPVNCWGELEEGTVLYRRKL